MPAHEEDKQSIQKNLLQELRDLQDVLNAETDDDIPVLSDMIEVSSADETAQAADEIDSVDATHDVEQNNEDDNVPLLMVDDDVPVLDSFAVDTDADHSAAANDAAVESLPIAETASKPAPFALVDEPADDSSYSPSDGSSDGAVRHYDSSAAESLIEEGLQEALQSLTAQMDDEALRVVDELVAEHAELIRQQLRLRLAAKHGELNADGED